MRGLWREMPASTKGALLWFLLTVLFWFVLWKLGVLTEAREEF